MTDAEIANSIRAALQFHQAGRLPEAERAYRQILAAHPDQADSLHLLSVLCGQTGRPAEGLAHIQRACAARPGAASLFFQLGSLLQQSSEFDAAITAYKSAIALQPAYVLAWTNLSVALGNIGDFLASRQACEKAVELDPSNPASHFNLGLILLKLGDFQRGWIEYEFRWKVPGLYPPRPFTQPKWNGQPLHGKTILLHADQGLGDTIQFIRYVPLIAQLGGRILVACDAPLHGLLRDFSNIAGIFADGPPPPCDVHCPITSLPAVFATTLQTIPAPIPYLHANPRLAEAWEKRLASADGRPKIGLVWAGRASHVNDRNRSLTLSHFAALAGIPATFYSLQKGPAGLPASYRASPLQLMDFTADLADWTDTAAVIANLDLVISVDTSVAHLAGAMGKPVWTLIPFDPDWRWLLNREDTPWYPTMRLFRQRERGNWAEVIERVRDALSQHVAGEAEIF